MTGVPTIDLSELGKLDPRGSYKLSLGGEGANWWELYAQGPAWLIPFRQRFGWLLLRLSVWVYPWELRETDEKVPVYTVADWCRDHPVGENHRTKYYH